MKTCEKVVATLLMLLIVILFPSAYAQQSSNPAVEKTLTALSVEEKLALLVGAEEILKDTIETQKAQINVPGAWAYTHAKSKPKITSVVFADVRGGLLFKPRTDDKANGVTVTLFPVPSVLAASWNKNLLWEVGAAIAKEASAAGVDVVTSPALNVVRNPLSGRNNEYFSEDPVLVSRLASAMIKGLQSQGVQVCLKYWFIDHQETNRVNVNALVGQRTLREIYLKTFERVIRETRPWGVLAACPQVNGVFQTEDPSMLTDLLRGSWGYEGVVVTDRYAGHDAVAQLKAGTDCLLPGSKAQYDTLLSAYRAGKITEDQINKAAGRLIAAMMKTPSYTKAKRARPDAAAHANLAYKAACESVVLLKNVAESLPLDTHSKKVAFYGVSAYHDVPCNPQVHYMAASSLVSEFIKAGYIINPQVSNSYIVHLKSFIPKEEKKEPAPAPANAAKGKPAASRTNGNAAKATDKGGGVRPPQLSGEEQMKLDLKQIAGYPFQEMPQELMPSRNALQQQVKYSQFAVVSIGRMSVEGRDRTEENGYRLTEAELTLIREVCAAYHKFGKKVFVVLNVEGMVDVSDWLDYPDAILFCGHAGQGAPAAVRDILIGKVNPSGKLTAVWPKQYKDIPSSHYFPENYMGKPRPAKVGNDYPATGHMFVDEVPYTENFRIGYRYFDEHQDQVRFPFGYGLSYTVFAYDKLKVERVGDSVRVQVRVTNTGRVAGKESVQLYVSPQRKNLRMEKPLKEMYDFAKTRLLQPDESQVLSMSFALRDMASFDENMQSWVLEKGNYTLKVGASSNDIRTQWPLQILETTSYPKD
ncbi:MAG: glycoside hydrolase family 3 protein [Bacteroidales bacterium]|nr:glycoside hydrolase family 3 protein [Bacteroidales bacterium]